MALLSHSDSDLCPWAINMVPLSPCRPSAGAILTDCHCPSCAREDADLTSHLSILHSPASLLLSFMGYVPSAPLTSLSPVLDGKPDEQSHEVSSQKLSGLLLSPLRNYDICETGAR